MNKPTEKDYQNWLKRNKNKAAKTWYKKTTKQTSREYFNVQIKHKWIDDIERKARDIFKKYYHISYIPSSIKKINPKLEGCSFNDLAIGYDEKYLPILSFILSCVKGKYTEEEYEKFLDISKSELKSVKEKLKQNRSHLGYQEEKNSLEYFINKIEPIYQKINLDNILAKKTGNRAKTIKV